MIEWGCGFLSFFTFYGTLIILMFLLQKELPTNSGGTAPCIPNIIREPHLFSVFSSL